MNGTAAATGSSSRHAPEQRAAPEPVRQRRPALRQPASSFSVVVLARPDSDLAERLEGPLRLAGAADIRYASSPADLLRGIRVPHETGLGIISRSPRAQDVAQLVVALRRHGWRRLVVACRDGDDPTIRLAIAAKVRCLVLQDAGAGESAYVPPPPIPRDRLSQREVEVLQAIADGHTNQEVGELLGLSGLTVKSHLARIGRKTGTGDRAGMVAAAMRAGIIR